MLSAPLNEKVIGKGRANELTIEYQTEDLANRVGNIWNLNLPKTANLDDIKNYDVKIIVPADFGPTIFISPEPKDTETEGINKIFYYDKDNLSGESITAAFGANQTVNFKLDYHLRNDGLLPVKQEIALPPDIKGMQQIYYESLDPKPLKVYKDIDSNVLAVFKVNGKSDLNIQLRGSAKIFGKQINPQFGGKMHELPENLVNTYTTAQPFWEAEDPKVQEIAQELFDPKKNVAQNAQAAYHYITKNLEYNYDIVKEEYIERQGARNALTLDSTWACMEFTDSFIAITRAMGIPSRELNGYAFSNSESNAPVSIDLNGGDMLHSWAEYYDPNFGWVPVDPTWGTTSETDYFTKLDTNHLAFVIKGVDSEYPHSAGSYRVDPDEKQVNVDFAQEDREFSSKINLKKTLGINLIKIFQGKRPYSIAHTEGPALYDINNTGKDLLPFQEKVIYLNKNQKEIPFTDFNGIPKTQFILN